MISSTPLPRLFLITGERGAGKTTLCARLAEQTRAAGHPPAGVLSRSILDGRGERVGLEAKILPAGDRVLLARTDQPLLGPAYGPFRFSQAGLERVVRRVRALLRAGAGWLLIDEIGPLEMELGLGFRPLLDRAEGLPVVLVVRPSLLEAVRALPGFRGRGAVSVEVRPDNRDRLPGEIAEQLGAPGIGPARLKTLPP